MKYHLSYTQANHHYLDVKVEAETKGESKLHFQLPAWRPGRYQLANFAKNIQRWKAFDEEGVALSSRKLSKDLWEVDCKGKQKVIVEYNYFAFELNAGSTFLNEDQLYVNPVNCLLYVPERLEEICQLQLDLPDDYEVAIALEEAEKNCFAAQDFDELADSPFIASASLKSKTYKAAGSTFYLWFQGECKPAWEQLINDFKAFTEEQIKFFGDFPCQEYHFLFQIQTSSNYHGVEHAASTVISLGPSYSIFDWKGRYEDLLGVSSHELFHTWNVKRIRPVEMWPYDFSKENYSRLGYLAEGATTWYGDVMLYRSKVFRDEAFFRTFNQLLDRHFNNLGVENLSVADSSFDTWLDGYELGVPNRKSSIYTEGALITFMLDVEIRKATKHKKSFDDVMHTFYQDYFKKGKGISEADYQEVVENTAGKNLGDFFNRFINGAEAIDTKLEESLDYFGLTYKKEVTDLYHESHLGVKLLDQKVVTVYPNSVADRAGISVQDEVSSINGIRLENNLSEWLKYFAGEEFELEVYSAQNQRKVVKISCSEDVYYAKYTVSKLEEMSNEQEDNFQQWFKG
ncbi:MAG: PDZ domain-containing protein [Vicingaceae bacterium]